MTKFTEQLELAKQRGYVTVRQRSEITPVESDLPLSNAFYQWCKANQKPFARMLTRVSRGWAWLEIDFITIPEGPFNENQPGFLTDERVVASRARNIIEDAYPDGLFLSPRGRKLYGFGGNWWYVERCPLELADELMAKLVKVAADYPIPTSVR